MDIDAATGRVPSEPGSREPSPSVSAASGFDPSRGYHRDPSYPRPKNWNSLYDEFCPVKTCPSSRHVYMIADALRDFHSPVRRVLIDAGFEPDHMASSIEIVVESLWKARRFLDWVPGPKDAKGRLTGEWLPIGQADEVKP